jgi:serine/threonine protein kinase
LPKGSAVSNSSDESFEPTLSSGATSSLSPGMLIGERYRLEQLLGRGGQGSVWRAHHLTLGVPVALKLTSLSSADEQCAARLLQEARAAARLSHPAVVRVFDLGCHEGREPFVVMELLEGQSLARRLEREKRLAPAVALRLLLPIADALRAAHELGFVHRDIKPQNIFLARHEGSIRRPSRDCSYPKLLDFGVVKVASDPVREGAITRAGVAVGSPLYLSPEQALCGEVDARSDVWGFCATVYECVTGTLPFGGSTYLEVVRAILESEPRSLADHGVEDEELWQILQKGLSKSPDDRWSSMAELGAALANLLTRRGVHEDAAGRSLAAVWAVRASAQAPVQVDRRAPSSTPPPVSLKAPTKGAPAGLVGAAAAGVVLSGTLALLGLMPRETQAEAAPKLSPVAAEPARPAPPVARAPLVVTATTAPHPLSSPVLATSMPPASSPSASPPAASSPSRAAASSPETKILAARERAESRDEPAPAARRNDALPPGAACVKGEPELLEAY